MSITTELNEIEAKIVTQQQLVCFQSFEREVFNDFQEATVEDFNGYYVYWCFEKGYFFDLPLDYHNIF